MKDARAPFAVVLIVITWFVFVRVPANGCDLERQRLEKDAQIVCHKNVRNEAR